MKVRVAPADACWDWLGSLDRYGYGKFTVKRTTSLTSHRVAFRLRRRLAADAYRVQIADRMAAAPWRRHLSVVVDADGSYTYTAPRPQPKGGGSDEAQLGLVTPNSLAGGKGTPSGLPHKDICRYCGEPDERHTGQCPVVS